MMLLQTSPSDFLSIIGLGVISAVGNSIIILALVIVVVIALAAWRLRLNMQETYFIVFIALGFLRVFANDQSFNDVGIFGMLHNLLLMGSAIIWAKVITNSSSG